MKYSIIIPTYNHCDDLLKPCVEAIIKYSRLQEIELIVVANGCKDETPEYLKYLEARFARTNIGAFKYLVFEQPLGYSGANNKGINIATCDKIVLLNNDAFLLDQPPGLWTDLLNAPFDSNSKCGITCLIKGHSDPAGQHFAVFFCVMIHRKVFDTIGLLNEEYGVGGGEDTEFSIEAERAGFEVIPVVPSTYDPASGLMIGNFPIYHKGEGTMHDSTLVPEWNDIFLQNSLKLAKKYNKNWYRWRLSNYAERALYLKDDLVDPRETTRYRWASERILGKKVFELGCTNGYGVQFLPKNIKYTGLDYDRWIIECAIDQQWRPGLKFINADINTYKLEQYDTIIAFEVIEHLDNGLEIVEKLKQHCKRLLVSVPRDEPVGFWGPHHKLHGLKESMFKDFKFTYINIDGELCSEPDATSIANLMLMQYDRSE